MKKTTDEPKAKVYLCYESSESGGGRVNDEEWSDRHPRVKTLSNLSVHRERPEYCGDSLEVPPELLNEKFVYLVVVRYRDGDTFGHTTGDYHFYSVRATREEVDQDRKYLESTEHSSELYLPWTGYFARLENVEVHLLPLL